MTHDLVILTDGKAGHLAQSLGLVAALTSQGLVKRQVIQPVADLVGKGWYGALPSALMQLKRPVLIGAGSRTHWPLLALAKRLQGHSVVLMRPGLPLSWFDAVIAPRHDFPDQVLPTNLFKTVGVLNHFHDLKQHQLGQDFILIGGPSKRHGWDDAALMKQLKQLMQAERPTVITTSRRTPLNWSLPNTDLPKNWRFVPVAETDSGFMAQHLAQAERCWVTEDSISMIYESLTAGCQTHLLTMPRLKTDRITNEIDRLIAEHRVGTVEQGPPHLQQSLQEAERAATWLARQPWFQAAS